MSDYLMSLLNNPDSSCEVAVARLMRYSRFAEFFKTP